MEILQGLFKWLANKWILLFSFLAARHSLKPILVFSVGAIIGLVGIQFVPIQLDVQMRTKEKGILQYYVDTGSGFNEIQSKRIQLTESPDFSHYAAFIPANGLRAIRIDPLETQGQLELLGLSIDYLVWHRQWHGQSELKSLVPNHEIEVDFISEGSLLFGQATGNDPSFVITDVGFFKNWQLMATIFSSVFGGVIALLLLVVIRHFGGIKTVLTNERAPLFIILIIAALLRIIYWRGSGFPSESSQLTNFWTDEGTYFKVAQYIMGHGLADYFMSEISTTVMPINPIYIGFFYSIFNSINAIRFINLLVSIYTIVLVYKLSKKLFNKPIGLLAAGICAIDIQLILYSPTLMTEPLFLFLFITAIYYLVLTIDAPKESHNQMYAIASTFFFTLAMLTRSIILLLPFFLLVMIGALEAWRSWRLGKRAFPLLSRAALPLLLPILIIGIVATKNQILFDRFMVATGSGSALWLGSRADTEGDDPAIRKRDYGVLSITGKYDPLSLQGDSLLIAAGKKNIYENPLDYAWWSVKKIGRLVIGNNLSWFGSRKNIIDWYRSTNSTVIDTANLIFQVILSSTLAVYGILGFLSDRQFGTSKLIVATSIVYFVLFSIPFLALHRYGLPLQLLLIMPASAIIYGAWLNVKRMRKCALLGLPFIFAIVLNILFMG